MQRNAFVAGLASLTLVLGACGDDVDERARTIDPPASEASDDATENAPEPVPEPETLDVEAALLTLEDMPTGWTEESDDTQSDTDDNAGLCGVELLDDAQTNDAQSVDDASAEFSAGDFGPLLSHTVAAFDDDHAEQALEVFTDALSSCDEWTEESEDGPVTFRPAPLSFPSFGDDTLAIRFDVESELFNATMDMIAWRQANTINLIAVVEVLGTPDAEQTEEFVTVADERIESLL